MYNYKFFNVEQYDKVSVLTWTESAATRILHNGELRVELRAFLLTTRPSCVVVSFAQLRQCPSALIGGLVGLNRQLQERGIRLTLCEMNQRLREQFERLHLDSVFEIRDSVADAIVACEEAVTNGV
jgi:anti-anti-sigma regulatory factor